VAISSRAGSAARGQGGDQDGRGGGLYDERGATADRRGDQDREDDDQADLPGAGADQQDDAVAEADADRHADDQFDRTFRALPDRGRQGDDGGDGREERARPADQVVGYVPRDARGDAGLDGEAESASDPSPAGPGTGAGPPLEVGEHAGEPPLIRSHEQS
jgi:hypothetical protein